MTFAVSQNGNPFPGLRSFEREQAHLFFGRDKLTKELIARLGRHRFLPIVGMSGSGKSSLVRAGLIPALTDSYINREMSGWRIAVLRPGRNPIHELAMTLSREFGIDESEGVLWILSSSTAGLARVAQQYLGNGERLLVLVDQFEEIFRYGEENGNAAGETNDAAAFVKLLLAAADQGGLPLPGFERVPVFVVTTMRSDFLGRCSQFRGLPEALNATQYLIPRLTREQQREVIEGPVGMAGAAIEPALVQRLLNDLGDNPDQLPALQHALMRTWEQSAAARAQGKAIAVADYEAVGGMADALNRDADRVFASLSTDDVTAAITRRVFQRLVRPGAPNSETRSPTPLSELVAITAADESDVRRVINVFQERGFLTVSRDEDPIIDITHESLICGWDQLTTWVQEEARSAAIYHRLADQAALYANKEASLLVDPQLQLTLNWAKETKPNKAWSARYDSRLAQALEFLIQSRNERDGALERVERERRSELKRAHYTALVLGILLLLAIGASMFAAIQWNSISRERDRSSRLFYDSNIFFASSDVAAGQFTMARERLDQFSTTRLSDLRSFEWFYLWGIVHSEKAILSGHSLTVRSIAFSPDGKILASASDDKTVKLWDIATRREVATFSGHYDYVRSVAFSPDGKTLASAGDDSLVRLWDIATRKLVATLSGHSDYVLSVAFSPDGKTLASAGNDKTVKLWDIATRNRLASLAGHSHYVSSVAFSMDGTTLASASYDNTIKLWDTATRREVVTLVGHSMIVTSLAFSPDSKTLASVSYDNTVKLWDIAAHKHVATLSGHSDPVLSVTFSPDGKTLASAGADNILKLWDVGTRKPVTTIPGHSDHVLSVAFSPDGKTLASAGDSNVKLWDAGDRKELAILSGHSEAVLSVAFSPDGNILASASADKTVKLWDISARKELTTLLGHSDYVRSVAFSPDGRILASASADKTVKLWDTAEFKELATLSGHFDAVWSVVFSPDGKILASAGDDNAVKLWDVAAHKELTTLLGHSDFVRSVAFSPDGKILASASYDHTVKLWNITEGDLYDEFDDESKRDFWKFARHKPVATLSGHSHSVLSVTFSRDGVLASASADKTVKIWHRFTSKPVATIPGHSGFVLSVVFSPDGKTLASASDDKTVKLWDAVSRNELLTLLGSSGEVFNVVMSPDGKTLASANGDKTVRLWFAATENGVEERRRLNY